MNVAVTGACGFIDLLLLPALDDVGFDAVVHLAGRNRVLRESDKNPLAACFRIDAKGTANITTAASRCRIKLFIRCELRENDGGKERSKPKT